MRQPTDDTEIQVGSQRVLFDRDGALWITSLGDGLRRAPAPELLKGKTKEFSTAVESFTEHDGLSDDYVRTILQDREGNVWVGTSNSLDRFRKTNLVPVVLPFRPNYAVLAAGDAGDVWIKHNDLMFRVHGGRADRDQRIIDQALFAYRDPGGAIWWLCKDAIYRYEGGSYTRVALPPSLPEPSHSIAATEDGPGALWLAAVREGLFSWKNGEWQRLETASEFANLDPRTAFTDWMGRAWFGYFEGTIILLKDEGIQRVFPADDSPVGGVRAINGRARHTWVGGELGLAFFDGNRFRRIIPADAETFDIVWGVEETSDGSLWLAESRGVIQVPASEVRQVLENPSHRVKYRIFNSFDGLPGTIAGAATNQKETHGTDGRLWFAASGGIVWVDPANIFTNTLPPPVLIRSVKANGRQFDSLANLVLPPRTTNLQIGYTALSLSVPEKVRFRYRLEGADNEWQDAGARREAFYTRLSPGKYHFRVIACNNDGVWNEEGARLDFNIAPAWFQTTWFLAFCVCIFLLLLWALYRLRLRQLARQFSLTLETRVDERTRIARELHDTLLQSFQGLTLTFQRARNLLPGRTSEAIQTLDAALDGAEQAIVEGRDAIHDLRSPTAAPKALEEEIKALGEELVVKGADQKPSVEFRMVTEGSPRSLPPNLHTGIFRIVREALRNAFSHSQAHLIETELAYTEDLFRIRIRDDGKGIDPAERLHAERTGHWGLRGMQERAQHLGGELEVWSEPGAGTEIELRIPAAIAYETVSSTNGFLRFWRRGRSQ